MDYAELTKAERERSAEALFVWRNQLGWRMFRPVARSWRRSLVLFVLVSGVLVLGLGVALKS